MPPLGHSRSAFAIACSSVSAQLRCSCSTFGIADASLPASRAPSLNRANNCSILAGGASTVMRPSAVRPARLAVTGPEVAMRIAGATGGMVHNRVDSRVKCSPLWRTSRPASEAVNSFLITSTASNIRLMRSAASGQYCPTMCSLSASPDPSPSQCLPGCMDARVADAWATIAGCHRLEGVVTPGPKSPVVRSARAASTLHTNDATPCAGTQGWKWSVAMTPVKPRCSAYSASATASAGGNCASIAASPMCGAPLRAPAATAPLTAVASAERPDARSQVALEELDEALLVVPGSVEHQMVQPGVEVRLHLGDHLVGV